MGGIKMLKIKNCPVCDRLSELTWFVMDKVENLSPFDWALLKTALVSFGILIGSAFYKLFRKLAPLIALIFIATYIYTAWRIFCYEE